MILNQLGIFGWKKADENLVLASLLTGDPLLLIGNHGCAKTHVANKVAQALGRRFLVYDASKAMFEDILGFPNLQKLQQGKVEYVPSPVTVWDKELILIDEINRALVEQQNLCCECGYVAGNGKLPMPWARTLAPLHITTGSSKGLEPCQ
jgi:MoxR-like ATPase